MALKKAVEKIWVKTVPLRENESRPISRVARSCCLVLNSSALGRHVRHRFSVLLTIFHMLLLFLGFWAVSLAYVGSL